MSKDLDICKLPSNDTEKIYVSMRLYICVYTQMIK
jgi:hypothetical protein